MESGGQSIEFFDGGVGGTANPAYQACVEAFEYDDLTPADTRMLSLGTGYYPASAMRPAVCSPCRLDRQHARRHLGGLGG